MECTQIVLYIQQQVKTIILLNKTFYMLIKQENSYVCKHWYQILSTVSRKVYTSKRINWMNKRITRKKDHITN